MHKTITLQSESGIRDFNSVNSQTTSVLLPKGTGNCSKNVADYLNENTFKLAHQLVLRAFCAVYN
ncbi:MAG: hypothetical protein IPO23_10080 [Flavobacterium sp.]|nr:hypothetical protein [Flavobacterium sp.]